MKIFAIELTLRIASDLHGADGDFADNFLQSRDFVNATLYEVSAALREFQVCNAVVSVAW